MAFEQFLVQNAAVFLGFVATGGAALWRISQLEKRMDRNAEHAREDRRRLYTELGEHERITDTLRAEFYEVRGELRGKGIINGGTQTGHSDQRHRYVEP